MVSEGRLSTDPCRFAAGSWHLLSVFPELLLLLSTWKPLLLIRWGVRMSCVLRRVALRVETAWLCYVCITYTCTVPGNQQQQNGDFYAPL